MSYKKDGTISKDVEDFKGNCIRHHVEGCKVTKMTEGLRQEIIDYGVYDILQLENRLNSILEEYITVHPAQKEEALQRVIREIDLRLLERR